MPELPEVESVVRALDASIAGDVITNLTVHWARWLDAEDHAKVARALKGRRIEHVVRRAKFIRFQLDDGAELISHLRMTGRWLVDPKPVPDHKFWSATLHLASKRDLLFFDIRRFGRARYVAPGEAAPELDGLGVEPFDHKLTAATLYALLQARHRDLKAVLLDQTVIAGLGNIYVSEILFRAKINPFVRSDDLTKPAVTRFLHEMRAVLQEAIDLGGTTYYDFRGATNEAGGYQDRLRVYQRSGLPCLVCGERIERAVQGQRSTFFCPHCQKVPAQIVKKVAPKSHGARAPRL